MTDDDRPPTDDEATLGRALGAWMLVLFVVGVLLAYAVELLWIWLTR